MINYSELYSNSKKTALHHSFTVQHPHLFSKSGVLLQADIITYNALMNSCQKSTRWAEALHWLQRAQDRFLEPSVVSYTTAITALRQSSQWQLALEFLDKKWTLPTYNACITAVGAAWQQALCLLESLEGAQLEPDAGCIGYCFQCVFFSPSSVCLFL